MVSKFPGKYDFVGAIFQNGCSPKAPSTRSPWLLGKIRGPIWMSNDHLVMKGLSKNVETPENPRFDNSVRHKIAALDPIKSSTILPQASSGDQAGQRQVQAYILSASAAPSPPWNHIADSEIP